MGQLYLYLYYRYLQLPIIFKFIACKMTLQCWKYDDRLEPDHECMLDVLEFCSFQCSVSPGSKPSGDEIFRPSRPALGPTQPPVK